MSDEAIQPPAKKEVDWVKVAKKSIRRGKEGERRIAKLFMELTGRNFRKVPNSGGFNKTGGVVIADHKFCGDVICDDAKFAFCIESKNQPDRFNPVTLFSLPESSDFSSWWYQVYDDAQRVKLLPLLYFKFGKISNVQVCSDFVAITPRIASHLGFDSKQPHVNLHVYENPVWVEIKEKVKGKFKKERVQCQVKLPNPMLVSWRVLAKSVQPEQFFVLPEWVADEVSQMTVLDRRTP